MMDRIAFISEHASPLALLGGVDAGGQNVYIDRLALEFSRRGINVDVFTRREDPAQPRIVEHHPGVRVIHVQAGPPAPMPKEELFPFMDEFAADMLGFVQQQRLRYKLVHAHFWMSGYVANQLKQEAGLPYAITFHALGKIRRLHQGSADRFPDVRFRIEEIVARDADMVFAECPQDEADLLEHYNAPRERIRVVPCGFDPQEFHPLSRAQCREFLGLPQDRKLVLQLGRMVPRKGVENVIRGLDRLLKKDCDAHLLIVGGDSPYPDPALTPEIGRLQEVVASLGLQERVTFAGACPRGMLRYYYNAADVFASTPWYEPFGITILEAMACALPVIGANVGGIKYSVRHGETGFLVPPEDPVALAECLYQVLESPALARRLGENGLRRAGRFFTWERVATRILDGYQEMLSEELPETAPSWQLSPPVERGYREPPLRD